MHTGVAGYDFEAELWVWQARTNETWVFVHVPLDASTEIAELAEALPRAGFGAVKVRVGIGGSTWSTSIFPTGDGRYSLPLKKSVRARESLDIGDVAQVHLETVDV